MPTASGPDPRVYIPRDLIGAPGQTVTVPVMIEVTEPAGVTIGGFDLLLEFDPGRFTVTAAQLGTLLQGTDLAGMMTQPAAGRLIYAADSLVGTSHLPTGTAGTLVTLTVVIAAEAAPGPANWNLLATLGTGRTGVYDGDLRDLVLNPPLTNASHDPGDGILLVDDGFPPWHNPANGLDVDADGFVTALDGLIVINRLNAEAAGDVSAPVAHYYDVNNDSQCTPLDAVIVINHLNASALSVAEGEQSHLRDRVFGGLAAELAPLEDVLNDLLDDIAAAWR